MYSYVFSYDPNKIDRQRIFDFFNQNEDVSAWISPFAGTVLVVSNNSAHELSDSFENEFGKLDHLFVDIQNDEPDYQGWLDDDVWEHINNPEDF